MKISSILAGVLTLSLLTTAVFGAASEGSSKPQELNLYIWSEYMDPEIISSFEKEFKCKVIISLYESNEEMLAKLQAGGASQYDLVVPSDFIVKSLIKLGLLQPIDHAKVPNIKNLSKTFVNPPYDPDNKYSVAYQWGTVGIVYSKKKFDAPVSSWKALFEPARETKFMFFDSEREMIGAALIYKGFSVNSLDKKQLMSAADLIIAGKKKPGFMGFEGNVGGLNKVVAGAVDIAVAYNGDVIKAMSENSDISFSNPKEGTVVWVDSLCIPNKAPNAPLANAFINYILSAKVGAQLSNYNQFATPNEEARAFITPDDLKNPAIYPDAETQKRLQYVEEVTGGSAVFGELWKIIKTR